MDVFVHSVHILSVLPMELSTKRLGEGSGHVGKTGKGGVGIFGVALHFLLSSHRLTKPGEEVTVQSAQDPQLPESGQSAPASPRVSGSLPEGHRLLPVAAGKGPG